MFKAITYKSAFGPGPSIDIGALAEGLLFYERVAILGNVGVMKDLLKQIPPFIVLQLMKDRRLEFHFLDDQLGVARVPLNNGRSVHNLICFSSEEHTIEKFSPKAFKDAAGTTPQARIGASQFSRLIRPINHSEFDQPSILSALTDNQAVQSTVLSLIHEVVPEFSIPAEYYFRVEKDNNGVVVDTNIDFKNLNSIYHRTVPASHSSLDESYLLALIQDAYAAAYYAAKLDSEIAVHPMEKVIQEKSIEAVALRYSKSQSQIHSFTELTLSDSHAIREAVNAGRVPFSSVFKLLDSADKFRHWLHKQSPDADLLRAYYQETVRNSWVDKLPAKTTRWSIFTGIGLGLDALTTGGVISTAIGAAISAADGFLLDKLIKGWKPHQFVEKDLKALFPEQPRK